MIVREHEGRLLLVRQTDHAAQCGVFAMHWGGDRVAEPAPRASLVVAAAEHDNGWAEWEQAPRIDPATGQPFQFYTTPIDEHVALYRRGVARVVERDPYAGLLVALHALRLYGQSYAGLPPLGRQYTAEERVHVTAFTAELRALRDRLLDDLRQSPTYRPYVEERALQASFKLLQAWDLLSLHTLARPLRSGQTTPVPLVDGTQQRLTMTRLGAWRLGLDPYPFTTAPFVTPVPATVLPRRRYADDATLRRDLARAPTVTLEVRFDPTR
ncbi:MAG TPA: DUF3891 family protein [Chloroflexota bacterium]